MIPEPAALLAWYDRQRRALPWRAPQGERPDPYGVWLSEVMLQQTTVRAAVPYYARFLARWPDVRSLAATPLAEVLKSWAGLGYYARARNLHACARMVVEQHGGKFPASEAALRALPGIGDYTAAAIAAIAYDLKSTPVDGNVERVIARLFAVDAALPAAKAEIRRLARGLTPRSRAGDFAQALMDLGATLCTPKSPNCALCPWRETCVAQARGNAETFPRRLPKREGVLRRGAAFIAWRADGFVLVRTRAAEGLLGGMTEVPTTEWVQEFDERKALKNAPRFRTQRRPQAHTLALMGEQEEGSEKRVRKRGAPAVVLCEPDHQQPWGEEIVCWRWVGSVRHVFTHFTLRLSVYKAEVPAGTPPPAGARWVPFARIDSEALPSVMRKVVAHACQVLDAG